jgi:hypothetical protein
MTTATLDFNQPTLFKDRRFTRDDPPSATPDLGTEPATPNNQATITARSATPQHVHASPGRLTLDDVLSAAWEGLAGHHSVTCPVCTGSMTPRYGSGAKPVGGRCQRCGSTLG